MWAMKLILVFMLMFAWSCAVVCPSLALAAMVRGRTDLSWSDALRATFAGTLAAYMVSLAWAMLYVLLYMIKVITPDSILPKHVPFIIAPVCFAAVAAIDEFLSRNPARR